MLETTTPVSMKDIVDFGMEEVDKYCNVELYTLVTTLIHW